jgi:hypothetical protein
MRLKLISCQVFCREAAAVVNRSPNDVDIELLPKGLHEIGCIGMHDRLQAAIDRVDVSRYQAILLAYGFCNHAIVGLRARGLPLVVPRAHDCITLLLGSRQRYRDYFESHPGVYFQSSGWIEHRANPPELEALSAARRHGLYDSYDELEKKYGPEKARFLFDKIGQPTRHYRQLSFIEMGIEPDDRHERRTREEAARRGWKFEKIRGDLALLQRLVDGYWSHPDFVVVPRGWLVTSCYNDDIIDTRQAVP